MGSPCAAAGTRFVDRSGKSNPSAGENSVCGSMNRQNQKKTFLCCRRRSAYRCKQQSLPFRLYRHRQLNRQSNCRQKNPAFRQSDTPPGIAGCWLRRFCWGVRQPVCYRPYAVLSGSVARTVYTERYAGGCTAFRHGISDTRPCGQPVSVTWTFCPWPSNDLWQYDVVRLGQRAAYGTALRRRRVESNTSGTAMDRLTGGSSKRLSVLFRGLRFAGQQPNPRIFFPQASRRTSPPRSAGTAGTISANHGYAAAAVRRGGRAFVFGQPPVNGILFLRVLAQCVTITKDHNK